METRPTRPRCSPAGSSADAQRRAKTIRRKAREHFEEQGIQTLYLTFGFATWTQAGPGPAPNAPILLSAAELGQRGRLDPDFNLVVSDEWELNPTLLHVLRTQFGAQFDEQELDELAQPSEFHALTERLGRICEEVPGFKNARRHRAGHVLLRQVADGPRPPASRRRSCQASAGRRARRRRRGEGQTPRHVRAAATTGEFRRPVPPAREFLVLDADGTQSEVINSVRAGNHLVVNGPPGTGKSQTIANLIAALAADGKSVLFVAEKRAAIDAVTKRLDQVGLGDLVFDLHARNRSRRQIAQQLADALAASRVAQPADTTENDRALVRSRDRLTNVNEALHQPVPPWDVTAYELQGRLLGVKEADRKDLRIPKSALDKLAGEEDETAREALRDCVARQIGITKDGPWRKALEGETLKDTGEAGDALEEIGSLLGRGCRIFNANRPRCRSPRTNRTPGRSPRPRTWHATPKTALRRQSNGRQPRTTANARPSGPSSKRPMHSARPRRNLVCPRMNSPRRKQSVGKRARAGTRRQSRSPTKPHQRRRANWRAS